MNLEIKKLDSNDLKNYIDLITYLLNLTFSTSQFSRASLLHKHLKSPYGPSICFIAKEGDNFVGVRLFSRGELCNGTKFLQAVDTATHPDYQGKGVFKKLINYSLNDPEIKDSLLINFPNEKSFPQYLKYGWNLYHKTNMFFGIIRKPRFLWSKSNENHNFDKPQLDFIKWRMKVGSEKKEIVRQDLGGFGIVSQTIIKNKKFIRLHGVYGRINAHAFFQRVYDLYPKSYGVLAFDIDNDCCSIINKAHVLKISLSSNFKIAFKGDLTKINKIYSLNSDVY